MKEDEGELGPSEEEENKESDNAVKIAVLGQDLVGKTALISRFLNNKFPETRETTVEDQYKKAIKLNGVECELEILDTAGQEEYQPMMDDWIKFAYCFILVYSIDNKESFIQINNKYETILKNKSKEKNKISIIILGNKCDLDNDNRKVTKEEADKYANSIGVTLIETSALNSINVNEGFLKVIQNYLEKNRKKCKKNKGCPCF